MYVVSVASHYLMEGLNLCLLVFQLQKPFPFFPQPLRTKIKAATTHSKSTENRKPLGWCLLFYDTKIISSQRARSWQEYVCFHLSTILLSNFHIFYIGQKLILHMQADTHCTNSTMNFNPDLNTFTHPNAAKQHSEYCTLNIHSMFKSELLLTV